MAGPRASKAGTGPYLGVECSLAGNFWCHQPGDERLALALAQRLGLADVVARVLAARGIGLDDAASFLEPRLRDLLPDPSHLLDMDTAAERLATAIMQGEQIAVFGDYDVDGATSSALLKRFIAAAGGRARVYIPDRIKEGYGPNTAALLRLGTEGASVIVTVDCGTTSHEPLAAARAAGLDVVVVDHHTAEPKLPPALAVINPNRLDDASPHGQLAAVGVTFLLVVAVNRALRNAGWYGTRQEPDVRAWLDLVALGTVCDVVPLTGVNRAIVQQGLKVMAGRGNAGLRALADVAGIDEPPGAYHAGFVLGPRINAGGRVGASDLGSRLLATDDAGEALEIAHRLNALNHERQDIEAGVLEHAITLAEAEGGAAPLVMVAGEGWHPGVVGIVASRLKERFNRPAIVISFSGDMGSASGRSVKGVDLGAAIIAAGQAGLTVKGGGHAMAAGFTVMRGQVTALRAFLGERVERVIKAQAIRPTLYVDGSVGIGGASLGLVAAIASIGPFGSGNPEPRFVVPQATITRVDVVGTDHVRCQLTDAGGGRLAAISFRSAARPLGQALLNHAGRPLHIAGRLRENSWQGRVSAQLLIDDAAGA